MLFDALQKEPLGFSVDELWWSALAKPNRFGVWKRIWYYGACGANARQDLTLKVKFEFGQQRKNGLLLAQTSQRQPRGKLDTIVTLT